jgi:hypothetical protein
VSSQPALAAAGAGEHADAARAARVLGWVVAAGVALALATAVLRTQANPVLGAMAVGLVLVAFQRRLLAWPVVLGYVLAVIMFVPIRRYTLAGNMPFELEPYRLLIAIVLFAWLLAVLVDPVTRWRRLHLEAPVICLLLAVLASIVLNLHTITAGGLTGPVVKQLSFLASFLLVMYFASSVVTSREQLDRLLALLVAGGTLIAVLSIVEWRTGYNAFNHLETFVPVLHLDAGSMLGPGDRGFRTRAFASAQHPIALAAALVLLLPLAVYLFRRHGQPLWMACAAALTLGALATSSRTGVLMLATELAVFLWLKWRETVRLLPLLLPLLIVCQIIMPGTLGTFRATIFPEQGIVAEQRGGGTTGSGRVADLGPGLDEFARRPFFGSGYGTRLTSPDDPFVNARILDDEWLGLLIELGAVGVLCLAWLYGRTVRRLAAAAKPDPGPRGWLLTGLAASITAFAASMFTFDAFSFIQVTFMSFILLGFAAVALRAEGGGGAAASPGPPAGGAFAQRVRTAVSWIAPASSSATRRSAAWPSAPAARPAEPPPAPARAPAAPEPRNAPPLRPVDLRPLRAPAPAPAPAGHRRRRRPSAVRVLAAAGMAHWLIRRLRA